MLNLYEVEVLIKMDSSFNKIQIYNEIRGLPGVVTLNILNSNKLNIPNDKYEFGMFTMKFFTKHSPEKGLNLLINYSKKEIKGLIHFKPKIETLNKIREY